MNDAPVTVEQVRQILSQTIGKDCSGFPSDQDLLQGLELDSAQAMELLAEVEDRFEVEIPELEAARLTTLDAIVGFVRAQRG